MPENNEIKIVGYAITREDVEKLLDYLGQRPWLEVNELMVMLLKKVNGQSVEQPK